MSGSILASAYSPLTVANSSEASANGTFMPDYGAIPMAGSPFMVAKSPIAMVNNPFAMANGTIALAGSAPTMATRKPKTTKHLKIPKAPIYNKSNNHTDNQIPQEHITRWHK